MVPIRRWYTVLYYDLRISLRRIPRNAGRGEDLKKSQICPIITHCPHLQLFICTTNNNMDTKDIKALGMGALAWSLAVPAVKIAGSACAVADPTTNQYISLVFGAGLAVITTPLLSRLMGWSTPHERVRGIALALGVAQTMDGLLHLFRPDFYAADPRTGLACAGNIFYGAGLLGILSAYM